MRLSTDDQLAVEYYDHLDEQARREYREIDVVSFCDDPAAVEIELGRIDAGLKAHCLS